MRAWEVVSSVVCVWQRGVRVGERGRFLKMTGVVGFAFFARCWRRRFNFGMHCPREPRETGIAHDNPHFQHSCLPVMGRHSWTAKHVNSLKAQKFVRVEMLRP